MLIDYILNHKILQTWAGQSVALLIVYLIAAWTGLSLAFFESSITLIWPPTGVAIGVLLFKRKLWPSVFFGALIINLLTSHYNWPFSLMAATGNTLEGVIAVGLLLANSFDYQFKRPKDLGLFIAIAVVAAPALSAFVGNYGLYIGKMANLNWSNIAGWWIGDAVGAFFVAPLLWAWQGKLDDLEQQLAKLKIQEEKLNVAYRNIAQFPYIIAHDLQSPLTTITGFTEFLASEIYSYSPDVSQSLDYIRVAAENARGKITALLEFSKLDSESTLRVFTDLDRVLDEVIMTMKTDIQQSKTIIIREGVLPWWNVDGRQFAIIFQNLISNSIKYARPGSPAFIRVTCPDKQTICFKDQGVGIPVHLQDKAFAIFGKISKESNGQGMGLAICRRIIEHHGGRIWVDNDYTEGLSINFTVGRYYESDFNRGR